METEPGITVPVLLFTANRATGKAPVVVIVSQAGRAALVKQREVTRRLRSQEDAK